MKRVNRCEGSHFFELTRNYGYHTQWLFALRQTRKRREKQKNEWGREKRESKKREGMGGNARGGKETGQVKRDRRRQRRSGEKRVK